MSINNKTLHDNYFTFRLQYSIGVLKVSSKVNPKVSGNVFNAWWFVRPRSIGEKLSCVCIVY